MFDFTRVESMLFENILKICVPIDVAILGIAYPLVVNKISSIGDKYNSQNLPSLLEKEFPHSKFRFCNIEISIFEIALYFTVFLLFIASIFNNCYLQIAIFISSFFLVLFFFIWVNNVRVYSGKAITIADYLIKKYHQKETEKGEKVDCLLKSINDIALYAVQQDNEYLKKILLNFYNYRLNTIKKSHNKSKPLIFPSDLYSLISKINRIVTKRMYRELTMLEWRTIDGSWLIDGSIDKIKVSEETYRYLWDTVLIIMENQPFFLIYFWENSSFYFRDQINNSSEADELESKEETIFRRIERKKFLEFHYALGGFVLYKKQYKLLERILEYSNSNIRADLLLPENMSDIFDWFNYFRNNSYNQNTTIDAKYIFSGLDNLGNREQIPALICQYIVVLFIRVYKYHERLPLSFSVDLPNDLKKLSEWFNDIDSFKEYLNNILKNRQLISDLNFEDVVKDVDFNKFFSKLKENISNKIANKNFD